jgi:hypothetical protein
MASWGPPAFVSSLGFRVQTCSRCGNVRAQPDSRERPEAYGAKPVGHPKAVVAVFPWCFPQVLSDDLH